MHQFSHHLNTEYDQEEPTSPTVAIMDSNQPGIGEAVSRVQETHQLSSEETQCIWVCLEKPIQLPTASPGS